MLFEFKTGDRQCEMLVDQGFRDTQFSLSTSGFLRNEIMEGRDIWD